MNLHAERKANRLVQTSEGKATRDKHDISHDDVCASTKHADILNFEVGILYSMWFWSGNLFILLWSPGRLVTFRDVCYGRIF